MSLEIVPVPLLSDNYAYLVHDGASGETAVVDASEASGVERALAARGWTLSLILSTHHHHDHTGGNAGLKARFGCPVIGPAYDAHRLAFDRGLSEGDELSFGGETAHVLHVPGHTLGHVALHFARSGVVFTGDTLFSLGCGRLFEGTPEQMWHSLSRLAALPGATRVYCGHEYTLANARFALTVEPENAALRSRAQAAEALRAAGKPTIPSTMADEVACNPFLRAASPALRRHLGLVDASDVEVFADVRRRKDVFKA